jgi:hypothetical protein
MFVVKMNNLLLRIVPYHHEIVFIKVQFIYVFCL